MVSNKVEISSHRQLNHRWKITGINHEEPQLFSKRFTHKKIELLKVGMKMLPGKKSPSNHPAILFLLTTNLQKLGLKILSVSYFKYSEFGATKWRFQEIQMNQKDLTNEGSNDQAKNAGIQLFAAPLSLLENDEIDLTFTVNLSPASWITTTCSK